jgi:hypothetical protein
MFYVSVLQNRSHIFEGKRDPGCIAFNCFGIGDVMLMPRGETFEVLQ